jgi:hypothetical protein
MSCYLKLWQIKSLGHDRPGYGGLGQVRIG